MATESNLVLMNFPAAADLSAKQFTFVKVDSNGRVAAAGTAGELCIGVLQNTPSAIDTVAVVAVWGKTKVVLDATLAKGAVVKTSTDGQAAAVSVAAVSGAAANGSYALGILERGGDAGQIGELHLMHMGLLPTAAA